jgi:hypothetical protein
MQSSFQVSLCCGDDRSHVRRSVCVRKPRMTSVIGSIPDKVIELYNVRGESSFARAGERALNPPTE